MRSTTAQIGAVVAVALGYFALSVGLSLEWIDEGQVLYGAWRVARGDLPYRDFQHLYGPSLFFLNGALLRVFGEDLRVVRLGLVVLKAGLALVVYLLARRVARAPFALVAYAFFLAVWGSPLWLFNTPYAGHYAITWDLCGVLAVLSLSARPRAAAFLGGLCCGIAATFKQTNGLFAVLSLLLFLLFEPSNDADGGYRARLALRTARWVVVAATGALVATYVVRTPVTWGSFVIAGPFLATTVLVALRERRSGPGRRQLEAALACAAGSVLPLGAYGVVYFVAGGLSALVRDMVVVLPAHISWAVALRPPGAGTLLAVTTMAAAGLALGAAPPWRYWGVALTVVLLALGLGPLVVGGALATGLVRMWEGAAFGTLYWLPVVIVLVSARWFVASRRAPVPEAPDSRSVSLLFWHASAVLLSLLPGADFPHIVMVLPPFLPLVALAADRFQRASARTAVGGVVAALLVAGLAAAVVGDQMRGLLAMRARRPPGAGLPRATGVWDPSPRYEEGRQLVAYLAAQEEPHAPMLVLPSEQTLYFLAARPSALQEAEMAFYLLCFSFSTADEVRSLVDEGAITAALARRRPLVVERKGPALDRFRGTFPALTNFLDVHYRTRDTLGPYTVREWVG